MCARSCAEPARPSASARGAARGLARGWPTLNTSVTHVRVRQPHTRSQRPAALSAAAQCCRRRVRCTLNTSVTHVGCASLPREASAQLPSALQPNAALTAPSAKHAQHERDSPRTSLKQQASTQLPQCRSLCCHHRAECHARSARAWLTLSAPVSDEKPVPSCPQRCSPMLQSPRRVPCTFNTSAAHIKCGSLTHEASALLPSARQPNAAIFRCHARPTQV